MTERQRRNRRTYPESDIWKSLFMMKTVIHVCVHVPVVLLGHMNE